MKALLTLNAYAQAPTPDLKEFSAVINKDLPEVYDHATKLMSSTLEKKYFNYHFILNATREVYSWAMPKVQCKFL